MGESGLGQDYKRIAEYWKELGLKEKIEQGVKPDNSILVQTIANRFPMEIGEPHKQMRKTGIKHNRRSNKEWRALLSGMYTHLYIARMNGHKDTVKSYCANHLKSPESCRRINDVWSSLELDKALLNNMSYSNKDLMERIQAKYPDENEATVQGNKRVLSEQSHPYFNQNEEAFLCESASALARLGFPIEKSNLHLLCSSYLSADAPGVVDAAGVSMSTVERTYKDDNLKAKGVDNIDPKRASQADPLVLNAFYHQLDAAVAMAHEVRPDTWPARCADMLPTCLYNTDEQGPNPTKLRNPVLIPSDMVDAPRIFQLTRKGDNKMPFHYSVANVVRADGAQAIPHKHVEGAPPPMVLIADPSNAGASELDDMDKQARDKILANQSENDEIKFNPQVFTGWFDEFEVGARDTIVNPFGFKLRATPTGSMLK